MVKVLHILVFWGCIRDRLDYRLFSENTILNFIIQSTSLNWCIVFGHREGYQQRTTYISVSFSSKLLLKTSNIVHLIDVVNTGLDQNLNKNLHFCVNYSFKNSFVMFVV